MRPLSPKIWGVEAPRIASSVGTNGVQQMLAGRKLAAKAPNVKTLALVRSELRHGIR